jgi:hypothetical protein
VLIMVSLAWRETAIGVDTMLRCQYCISGIVTLFNDCSFRTDAALIVYVGWEAPLTVGLGSAGVCTESS